MSIYCTLWALHFPSDGLGFRDDKDAGIEVFAQAVPSHIQNVVTWLPKPVRDPGPYHRAVVITTDYDSKGTKRSGQEYRNPLLVVTGKEYASWTVDTLYERVCHALQVRHEKQERAKKRRRKTA